ncbi:unnamed protein product [Owenia fusiformis]|uniref:Seipin n=1 Tax=Owenia fusiformis TaxID=6347 RepID=A0A8S4PDG9_OWEFU|nr:unnamed protein product [Owenia fusiformis]
MASASNGVMLLSKKLWNSTIEWAQDSTVRWANVLKQTLYRVLVSVSILTVLLWISVFIYGAFYFAYMPSVSHVKPVHFRFSSDCERGHAVCSFPSSNISLVKPNQDQLLMRGQQYKIFLDIEMPESPANRDLGMFMVEIQFYTKYGVEVQRSSRSAILQYRSTLLNIIYTLVYSPLLLLGYVGQKQALHVELIENYVEDPYRPALGAYIEVQSKHIEVYSSRLSIHAHFSGIRYLLFYYPVASAFFGILTNMLFLAIISLLSWYRFIWTNGEHHEEIEQGDEKQWEKDQQGKREKYKYVRKDKRDKQKDSLNSIEDEASEIEDNLRAPVPPTPTSDPFSIIEASSHPPVRTLGTVPDEDNSSNSSIELVSEKDLHENVDISLLGPPKQSPTIRRRLKEEM